MPSKRRRIDGYTVLRRKQGAQGPRLALRKSPQKGNAQQAKEQQMRRIKNVEKPFRKCCGFFSPFTIIEKDETDGRQTNPQYAQQGNPDHLTQRGRAVSLKESFACKEQQAKGHCDFGAGAEFRPQTKSRVKTGAYTGQSQKVLM